MIGEMKKIGFDIDDVLCQFMRGFADYIGWEIAGVKFKFDDMTNFHTRELPRVKLDKEGMIDLFNEFFVSPSALNIPVCKGALNIVNTLKSQGKELFIVTSRGDEAKSNTLQRVKNNFGDSFSEIYFTAFTPKSQVVKELGLDMFIDDNPAYCEDIIKTCNIPVYMPTVPWNKGHDHRQSGILRIDSLDDIKYN